ncbi:unnamed protein product [marine sediment metagenome]|uniref:Uncharacterized protein n=1 Tax=marine sediment metagenome TaxID=412755 RepID=X1RKI9_9ZZZZ
MPEEKIEPILKLPPETKTRLETMRADVKRARHAIKVMEELGLDVLEIKEKLDWADNVRKTLLREFV